MEPVAKATVVPMGEMWVPGVDAIAVSPRSRRLRWGIAAAVVVCVVVATAAGAFVLSGASGVKSLTATIAPKNSLAFLEVRTDLPGDQHANLADFMSHFPGFQDQAQFDNALDELLNGLTSAVSPDLAYSSAFKPWMEGEVSVAVTDLGTVDTSTFRPPSAVAIFALKDRAAAEGWVTSELNRIGVAAFSQSYAGTTLYTTGSGTDAGAYAFTNQDLLLGTIDAVKAALDSKTNGSLADNANYQAAMNSLSDNSLARFYLDPRAVIGYGLASYHAMAGALLGAGASPLATLLSPQESPAWIAGSIRAEASDIAVDVVLPNMAATNIGNHTSALARALPASTVGVLEVHSIGKVVSDELSALRAKASAGSAARILNVEDTLARFGGIDWLGDGVAVVTKDGSTYGGGLVAQAADASTASAKVALLTNLAALSGGSLNISSRSETYKGVDITLIGIPSGSAGIPVTVAVAASGNLIVAGYTDAFVKAVVDTSTSASLASQSDYSTVMATAGLSNVASFYVNIPALVDAIGQAVFAASPSRWTVDYKPYLDHFGGIGSSVVDGNTVMLRLVVTAK